MFVSTTTSSVKFYPYVIRMMRLLLIVAGVVVSIYKLPSVESLLSSSSSSSSSLRSNTTATTTTTTTTDDDTNEDGVVSSIGRRNLRSIHQRNSRKSRFQKVVRQHQQRKEKQDEEEDEDENPQDQKYTKRILTGEEYIYVNSETGKDSQNASTPSKAVKTLKKALVLVGKVPRPLTNNLIVSLTGTFELGERLVLKNKHKGTNDSKRVIFRGSGNDGARVLGGRPLEFVKVSSLGNSNPAMKLAKKIGANITELWAAPPIDGFPSMMKKNQWSDGDCRDKEGYVSPPTLSINGEKVMTRAREPNLPRSGGSSTNNDININGQDGMGEVLDSWMRTKKGNNKGITYFKSSDKSSVTLASDDSWDSGSVVMHMFPQVDWFDARVPVGERSSNSFISNTNQKGPGDPEEGKKFKITTEARYYLEGAVEYLDNEGEYFVSLGEVIEDSKYWTLFYPPTDIKNTDFTAVLSLSGDPLLEIDTGESMYVTIENVHFEASKRWLGAVYGYDINFVDCNFVNAGFDGMEVYGQRVTFRNCVFEGTGGSSVRLSDDRDDFDDFKDVEDGTTFGLFPSGNAIADSLLSNFASTCRHYCEGVSLGGFGTIVANNHFRSSNMAAIDLVGGGTKIMHNIFSHVSDGSYDDGAIHWVAASPMERGVEVSYNIFFRNGVSKEPCNAKTSCYQADIYMDDSAGAMTINGNVIIKDKVLQEKPPNKRFAPIQWLGILINGGADVTVYDNIFLGPEDNKPTQSAIYGGSAVLYEQTCGGTIWPDDKKCGHTGVCASDEFYSTMRKYKYKESPWKDVFPELLIYNANPSDAAKPLCASDRRCPVAAWNQTVVCNAAVGKNRDYAHRLVWPTDSFSLMVDEAIGGVNVPLRIDAVIEQGNRAGTDFDISNFDVIEKGGVYRVIELAKRVATAGEASYPKCDEGTRRGGSRLDLVGRFNNKCIESWITNADGIESCEPCDGTINCAPRDIPSDNTCSCNYEDVPTTSPKPSSKPVLEPTSPAPVPIPTSNPTPLPTSSPNVSRPDKCRDNQNFLFKDSNYKNCEWARKTNKCNKKSIKEECPESCNRFPTGCDNCIDNNDVPLIKSYEGKGYCNDRSEKETKKSVSTPRACWAQCQNEFGLKFKYAELTDGTCFCTKKCSCMSAKGNRSITAIVPCDFKLRNKC